MILFNPLLIYSKYILENILVTLSNHFSEPQINIGFFTVNI